MKRPPLNERSESKAGNERAAIRTADLLSAAKTGNQVMPSLPQLVAERLGPDGVYGELKPFIPSLQPPRDGRVEVQALCPYHDDHDPSWCWNLAKGIAICHVCDGRGNKSMVGFIAEVTNRKPITVLDEYCLRLGLARPRQRTLKVADYALLKRLPEDFLRCEFSLDDGPDGMLIPYFDENRVRITERLRRTIAKRPRWRKGTAGSRLVYGLQCIDRIRRSDVMYAVEGESDLHTAWFYGLPALALPSATMGHRSFAEWVSRISPSVLIIAGDMDSAGWLLAAKLYRALNLVAFPHEIRKLWIPTKDISQLHLEAPDRFKEIVKLQTSRAPKAFDALAEHERSKAAVSNIFASTVELILRLPDLNPTDRIILIASARIVADDPRRPLGVSNAKLGRAAGVDRRTIQNRLPELQRRGLLERDSTGLRFGAELVKDFPRSGKIFLPPYPQYSGGSQKGMMSLPGDERPKKSLAQ